MKRMKKAIALVLVLMLVLSMSVSVFAAKTPEDIAGSITINKVNETTTYEIYRILDLVSYNTDEEAYLYKVNAAWEDFFSDDPADRETDENGDLIPNGLDYFTVDANDMATWKVGVAESKAAELAQLALAYAKRHNIAPVASSDKNDNDVWDGAEGDKETDFKITFDVYDAATGETYNRGVFAGDDPAVGLPLGYYLVDSTAGALCGLTTTNPNGTVNAKNHAPTIEKKVYNAYDGQWGNKSTAAIGSIVEFRNTIKAYAGSENFVVHDQMEDGLTFVQDATQKPYEADDAVAAADFRKEAHRGVWKIEHISHATGDAHKVDPSLYTVNIAAPSIKDTCDFEIVFSQQLMDKIQVGDEFVIYYNAMLNRNAVIGGYKDDTNPGNTNEAWLDYGDNQHTTHGQTSTYTFGINIVKTNGQNDLLDGAYFEIYDAKTGGNKVGVVPLMEDDETTKVLDRNGNPVYRLARADEEAQARPIYVKDGIVRIVGFDNGTYWLEETQEPSGFTKLTERQAFTVEDDNIYAIIDANGVYSVDSGIQVVNKSGSMLPETGGMGTTLFITFGAIAVLGTGVLLVTKKRMGMIQD